MSPAARRCHALAPHSCLAGDGFQLPVSVSLATRGSVCGVITPPFCSHPASGPVLSRLDTWPALRQGEWACAPTRHRSWDRSQTRQSQRTASRRFMQTNTSLPPLNPEEDLSYSTHSLDVVEACKSLSVLLLEKLLYRCGTTSRANSSRCSSSSNTGFSSRCCAPARTNSPNLSVHSARLPQIETRAAMPAFL